VLCEERCDVVGLYENLKYVSSLTSFIDFPGFKYIIGYLV